MLGRVYGHTPRIPLPDRFRAWKYLFPSVLIFFAFGIIPVIWVLYQSTFVWSAFAGTAAR